MPSLIRVSAGILTRGHQLLICQRRSNDLHPLQWEFPGGKANAAESDEDCLRRELREELQVEATIGEVLDRTTHTYPSGRSVALTFFHVPRYQGAIINMQFQALVWVTPAQLLSYDFLEGDREFVSRLAKGEWSVIFSS
jgi:8-oxo-dGTP diphosphatase